MNVLTILTLLRLAARRGHGPEQPAHAAADISVEDPLMIPTTFRWRATAIEGTGLTIDLIDSDRAAVMFGDLSAIHNMSQVHEPVQLDVWVGPAVTLAWWRGRFAGRDTTTTPVNPLEVCGRTAQLQSITVAAQRSTGLVLGDTAHGHLDDHRVAEVHIAIAGMSPVGTGYVVSWRVQSSRRDALRRDEQHYLSSIRCRN
jgi:hypothetical protein